ncbi:MAG: hydrogen peroxide-inducible genes activator [Cyclobacteriaceae bacterium]|nr:hydrogen peroxide-inducible genes activator [Cyclobacteriaceae bacterium]
MTLQQLEYIVAVDIHRHFVKAAESCFVTQPTLSAMIHKLEEELDVIIFDRSRQPVSPTRAGEAIIAQARRVLAEAASIKAQIDEARNIIRGEVRLGIIPTVAPYLLPLFLKSLLDKYPEVKIIIRELTTQNIVDGLLKEELDAGILASPLNHLHINENPLYHERFLAYSGEIGKDALKKYILPGEIDLNRLWLLEEGHCFRSQVVNFCELKKRKKIHTQLEYEAGSIDSLIRIINASGGITILPEMAVLDFTDAEKKQLHYFKDPTPVREISMVTYKYAVKRKIIEVIGEEISSRVLPLLGLQEPIKVIETQR